ncbi:MAG: heme-binding protein [Verrucomicrobiales bacterium]|nr:heme-binding protein [Verrucomicrobiales bacterium]
MKLISFLLVANVFLTAPRIIAAVPESEEGFVSIFNGRDLSGWDGKPGWWRVEDGTITGESTAEKRLPKHNYLIWRGGKPADFELRLRFRLQGGNSGIQFRSRELPDWDTRGYQADMDAADQYTGGIYEHQRGLIASRGQKVTIARDGTRQVNSLGDPAELRKHINDGDWNDYRVVARGSIMKLFINGVLTAQADDRQTNHAVSSGVLGLQLHPGPPMKVQFKNIRLKLFTNSPPEASTISASELTATPPSQLKVAKDFKVELLYSPRKTQGSWVSMCVDPKGRLIVCDQYDGGLYRITPPPLGAATETKVEKINVELSGAQGLLWAFDSLYAMVSKNGKFASGLYRVRDTDGDDQLDHVELLRSLEGGGDHGWHALLAGPDGKSIYVVAGNGTRFAKPELSRVPRIWSEDHLLPRIPDARGFMTTVLAPGGCFYRVDPEGKAWELVANGFRNPYDAAFNRYGDLLTFDADMEWDMNIPWYRPTRICLVTSGAEFGWRNGAGKWPAYYPDSLPAVLDVGPGSPVGMTFGYGAKFPARYQEALFLPDWSYGRIYAAHLTPSGAAYKGDIELIMSGTPLPTTDIVVNPRDGAMYFVTGGWRIQTALYRVSYVGKESTAPAHPVDSGAKLRALRRRLEAFHGHQDSTAVKTVWPYLGHEDRYIRFAARVALEWQDPNQWREKALKETKAPIALNALMALVRVSARDQFHRQPTDALPAPGLQGRVLSALAHIDWKKLTDAQRVDLLRVYALTFTRLGQPDETNRMRLVAKFDPLFPATTRELNAELCELLAYLQSPSLAIKALALVDRAPTQEEQIEYMKSLRVLRVGWTSELREAYFKWFIKAGGYRGGASFAGFMKLIKNDAIATLSDAEKDQLKLVLEAKPITQSSLQSLQQVLAGHTVVTQWTVNDLAPLAEKGLHKLSFDRGRKLFGALGCFACHRFANEGGAVGPDLTSAGGRFSPRDLLESIIEPSTTLSDLYAPIVIQLNDGDSLTGQIVYLGTDTVQVSTDMLNPGETTKVQRKDIASIEASKTSPMPTGLLNLLAKDEIMDLLGYVLSGGQRRQQDVHANQ